MSPAETLRKAASLMRERANAICVEWGTRPWHAEACSDESSGYCPCIVAQGERKMFDEPQVPFIHYVCDAESGDHAAHIASWHPGVALAVADWLDGEAEWAETSPSHKHHGVLDPALAVARAYLGETS